MSSNSGAPDNKIEFKMLDYSVVDNDDTVSFKLEDCTIMKVKVGIELVGVATNYRNPDGSLHYAVNTSIRLYIIPHDKRDTLQKSQIKGSGASAEQQPPQGKKSLPSHIA